MAKNYTTAQGRKLDMGALRLKNETVKAVGNMNVNARGDIVDGQNNIIQTRSDKMKNRYNKETKKTNVTDTPVVDTSKVLEEDPFGPMDEPSVDQTNNKDDGFSLT